VDTVTAALDEGTFQETLAAVYVAEDAAADPAATPVDYSANFTVSDSIAVSEVTVQYTLYTIHYTLNTIYYTLHTLHTHYKHYILRTL
jgi:hypothetical protein